MIVALPVLVVAAGYGLPRDPSRPASCTLFSDVAQSVLRAINEYPRIRVDVRARAVVRAPIGSAAALLGPSQPARSGYDHDGQSDRCLGEHNGVS